MALEAIRGDPTLAELAAKHGVSGGGVAQAASESEMEKLHAKIGQLVVEPDLLAIIFGR